VAQRHHRRGLRDGEVVEDAERGNNHSGEEEALERELALGGAEVERLFGRDAA
jgi:hypothetical protein